MPRRFFPPRRGDLRWASVCSLAAATAAAQALAQETYRFDQGLTEVRFSWSRAGITAQSAEFEVVDGEVVIGRDDIANLRVAVTIDPASIETGVDAFNEHITSIDFFDVAEHAEIAFARTEGVRVRQDRALITGDLTIKGIPPSGDPRHRPHRRRPAPAGRVHGRVRHAYDTGFEATGTGLRRR